MTQIKPETPSERAALIVWYMAHGLALSNREIMQITGLSRSRARDMMCRISRVLPLYQDESHIWRLCAN